MNVSTRQLKLFRPSPASVAVFAVLLSLPAAAHAQAAGSPFDTGFTALQNLFTGTIAKVASLIAIVIGGYGLLMVNREQRKRSPALLREPELRYSRSTSFPGSGVFSQSCVSLQPL
jgi:type IV secretory pathway VirB2 component (pilin)